MDAESLRFLAAKLTLARYSKGRFIAAMEHGAMLTPYVVQRGLIHGDIGTDDGPKADCVEYSGGECPPWVQS